MYFDHFHPHSPQFLDLAPASLSPLNVIASYIFKQLSESKFC